jgi:uncharacterized protein YqfB (UPF0267 family)
MKTAAEMIDWNSVKKVKLDQLNNTHTAVVTLAITLLNYKIKHYYELNNLMI